MEKAREHHLLFSGFGKHGHCTFHVTLTWLSEEHTKLTLCLKHTPQNTTLHLQQIQNVDIRLDPNPDRIIRFWSAQSGWDPKTSYLARPGSMIIKLLYYRTYLVRLFSENENSHWQIMVIFSSSVRMHTDQSLAGSESVSLEPISRSMSVV